MQNELTLEENMELARKFVQEQFVAKGMIAVFGVIADFSIVVTVKTFPGSVGCAGNGALTGAALYLCDCPSRRKMTFSSWR